MPEPSASRSGRLSVIALVVPCVAFAACVGPRPFDGGFETPYLAEPARWVVLDAAETVEGCLRHQVWTAASGASGVGFGLVLDGPEGCDVDVSLRVEVEGEVHRSGRVAYVGGRRRWAYLPVQIDSAAFFAAGKERGRLHVQLAGAVSATPSYPVVQRAGAGDLLWPAPAASLRLRNTLLGPLGVSLPCGEAVYVPYARRIEVSAACDARISFDEGPLRPPSPPNGRGGSRHHQWPFEPVAGAVHRLSVEAGGTRVSWSIGFREPERVPLSEVLVP